MKAAGGVLLGIGLAALMVLPVVLHFGQKSHNDVVIEWDSVAPSGSVAGVAFGSGAAAIMSAELDGTTGWRPNDLVIWGPTLMADNNASRQLGILQALRETVRVFKDHLTKISSDEYDPNLVEADNLLRNDATRWILPSAEDRYGKAVEHLRDYVAGLQVDPPTSKPIRVRNVELMRLIQVWGDLLGSAHADLLRDDVSWFRVDDVFYHTTGVCHAIALMIPAIEIEYSRELDTRPVLAELFGQAREPLVRCGQMKPLIVLNGGDTSILANQRRNLDAYVTEARQKFYSVREELDK
jgi:hypothetical protein